MITTIPASPDATAIFVKMDALGVPIVTMRTIVGYEVQIEDDNTHAEPIFLGEREVGDDWPSFIYSGGALCDTSGQRVEPQNLGAHVGRMTLDHARENGRVLPRAKALTKAR